MDQGPVIDWLRDRLDALLALLRAFADALVSGLHKIEAAVDARLDRLEVKFWTALVLVLGAFVLFGWLTSRRHDAAK